MKRILSVLFLALIVAGVAYAADPTFTANPGSDPVPTGGDYATVITVPLTTSTKVNLFSSVPAYTYEGAVVQVSSGDIYLNCNLSGVATSGITVAAPATLTFGLWVANPSYTGICGTAKAANAAVRVLPIKKYQGPIQ